MDLGLRQIRVQILAGLHLPFVTSGKLLPVTKLYSLLCREGAEISPSWSYSVDCVKWYI